MALFRLGGGPDHEHLVRGDGIYLRPADARDFAEWAALREESREFLTPWEPTWPADDLTSRAFRRRLRRHSDEIARDEAYPFLVFRANHTLLGGLTLGQVRRGVAQTATLGYWMGAPHAGQGYMSRAVRAAVGYGFATLRLHRIEAACLPDNQPSLRLLEKIGFQREGLARAYLRINGLWHDHVLLALLDSDLAYRPPVADGGPASLSEDGGTRSRTDDGSRKFLG